jgi:Clostripain family.
MESKNQKDWVILFYLNGNNELGPEMSESKLAIEKEGSNDSVDVLVQYGRSEKRITEIIRPQYQLLGAEGYMGVRRYHIADLASESFKDLGNVNMADPKCLYDFIEWGMINYPAKHYMLVLGGHVFQYVGLMPDYSQNLPYLMGYPEMVNALNLINKNLGRKIDLLVLDTCYANRIEMLYELGKEEEPPVDSVLTYTSGGPISGLPYDTLISAVKKNCSNATLHNLVKHIIDNLNYDLIAYEINHSKLETIKKQYSDIAYCRLNCKSIPCCSPSELLTNLDENLPWYNLLKKIHESMPSLTICHKNASNKPFGHFYVSANRISDAYRMSLYNKLAFAKNNFWARLLCSSNSTVNTSNEAETGLCPFALKPNDLYALIVAMNPDLSVEQNKQILRSLIEYKGWTW